MGKKKLLELARDTLRRNNYAYRTEQAYLAWIKRYIYFHNLTHPEDLTERDIEKYLTYLAIERQAAPMISRRSIAGLLDAG